MDEDFPSWCPLPDAPSRPDRRINVQGVDIIMGHTPVIHVSGISGCYLLSRVKAVEAPGKGAGDEASATNLPQTDFR